jgi:hypothetical protein
VKYYDMEKLVAKLLLVPCRVDVISPAWLRNLVLNRTKRMQRLRL